jgi:hypothetical protein
MPSGIVICPDRQRCDFLVRLVRQFTPPGAGEAASCAGAAEVLPAARDLPGPVRYVLLSLVGGGTPEHDLPLLQQTLPDVPVLVELAEDNPEQAFALLRQGACNVLAGSPLTRAEKHGEAIALAGQGKRPYRQPLLRVSRPCREWGFMSMDFRPGSRNQHDYDLAVRPAMRLLGLDLRRYDEMDHDGPPDLRARIDRAIDRHPVLVAQISTFTPNTMYEIGCAQGKGKSILFLRRDGGDQLEEIPALLRGVEYLAYATMTELAMRLYFGLGGTGEELRNA